MITKVNDKATLLQCLKANKHAIQSYGVQSLGLFGSFVRDTDIHPASDIDLLLDFNKGQATYDNFIALGNFLQKITGRKVELVTRKSLSPFIGPYILSEVQDVSL